MSKFTGLIVLLALMISLTTPLACHHSRSSFQVLSLDIEPSEVAVGKRATIRAQIRNNSRYVEIYDVPLMVNGIAQDRKSVMLEPGTVETVEFTLTKYKASSYEISVGDLSATLEVQAPLPAAFQISQLEVVPTVVNINQEVVITARVTNMGGSQGTYTAELIVNGSISQRQKVTIPAESEYLLVFRLAADSPGIYTVSLGELSGEFMVIQPAQSLPPNLIPPLPPSPCPGGG
ncbi:MAG TPA: hypothetical protein EYP71_02300 [Dehalococcoidia bacterium]|nr:hypothetical protein [Dehalococcoidia bacterium]